MLNKIKSLFKRKVSKKTNQKRKLLDGDILVEFICKCGKYKTWVPENKITKPCPFCGRRYTAYYDSDISDLIVKEIKKVKISR